MLKLSKLTAIKNYVLFPLAGLAYALLTSSITLRAEAGNEDKYVGLQYPPVPQGVTLRGGWIVEEKGSDSFNSDYSITNVLVGNQTFLWLDRTIGFNGATERTSEVVSVLALPPLDENEGLFAGSAYFCHINGEYDPLIIVIAKTEDNNTEFITKVRKAWRVNLTAEKFDEIDVIGIDFRCENLGFGL